MTVSELSWPLLDEQQTAALRMLRAAPEDAYPVSSTQQGFLAEAVLYPGQGFNIEQLVLQMREPVEPEVLRAAWQACVDAYPLLRTSFLWQDLRQPIQIVHPPGLQHSFQVLEHREPNDVAQRQWLAAYLNEDRMRGIALDSAPLSRVMLVRFGGDTCRLVWTVHHAILDAHSVSELVIEVLDRYDSALQHGSYVPPPRGSFRDYVAWLKAQPHELDLTWWTKVLEGMPRQSLRGSAPYAGAVRDAALATKRWDAQRTQALNTACKSSGILSATYFQAAWAAVLAQRTCLSDVHFGVLHHGRPHGRVANVHRTFGCFINNVPFRVRLDGATSVRQWLAQVQDLYLQTRTHQHCPLQSIRQIGGKRPGDLESLVNVVNWDSEFEPGGRFYPSRRLTVFERPSLPLVFQVFLGAEIRLMVRHDLALLSRPEVQSLLTDIEKVIDRMIEHPEGSVQDLRG